MARLILSVGAAFVFAHVLHAQQWSQWLGNTRDGTVSAGTVPATWPERYASAWRVEVGEGYSSPVLSDGLVFVHSRRDPQEVVTALDLRSGETRWSQAYDAAYQKNQYAVRMGKGPNATPLVADGRLFTLGATAKLTAWDARTGRHLWQKDFSPVVDVSKLFCGTAASPIIAHGSLVVQVGSDVHGGTIVALDPATGGARWEWRGAGPGYASPILIEARGVSQLVTLTNSSVLALDARTGRQLWTWPLPNEWHENIVTPLWTGTHVVVSSNTAGTTALALATDGTAWRAAPAWRNEETTLYMSTPVLADGRVYGFSNKRRGSFVAMDAATGRLIWQSEGRDGMNAVALTTPSHVLFLSDLARLTLVRRGAAPGVERSWELETGATWATPIVLGPDLIVKDHTSVWRLSGG